MNYKTHPEITVPLYRSMLAREMRMIRKIAREQTGDAGASWANWYINGAETMLRRLCNDALVKDVQEAVS